MTTPSSSLFNAHHSPVGAFASFTLGYPGASGGLGLELGKPANENVFIGLEMPDGSNFEALPFFGSTEDASQRYDIDSTTPLKKGLIQSFPTSAIKREFGLGTDTWRAGDLTFTIYSAPKPVPDPIRASKAEMMAAIVPAVFAELTIDNRQCKRERIAFFGYEGSNPYYNNRRLDDVSLGRFTGVGQGSVTAIVSASPGVYSGVGFGSDQCLRPEHKENLGFGLGRLAMLMAVVPPGKVKKFRFAICFYRSGVITSGLPAHYLYTRYFGSIEKVATYALDHWEEQRDLSIKADKRLSKARLSLAQKFQIAHAVRSYYGSTELLAKEDGAPFWAVNEGEYRMLNTFDLTVDHLFFELDQNPWAVRNQLDWFVRRYSYIDTVRLPGDTKEYPGGLSFTHDMGIGNCISRPGYSSYERAGLTGCFSYMTHEQLVNWVCCATTYVLHTGDHAWLKDNLRIFKACLTSLVNRDHPDPKQRDGVMSADSSRCLGGAEITTYDSLDVSLGQARNNLYLAVKTWAAYLGLREIFNQTGMLRLAGTASNQARLCAATIASHLNPEGFIPAVMGEGNTSRIIPAIEGLIFPHQWGMKETLRTKGEFANLMDALRTHLKTILHPGICKFPDDGWKLSSTNDNSWLSKIYICQFVARKIFGFPADEAADKAHCSWLTSSENGYYAWSDQMVAGIAKASKYYPRGVTSWLWLQESDSKRR